jgi:hypothetical protein
MGISFAYIAVVAIAIWIAFIGIDDAIMTFAFFLSKYSSWEHAKSPIYMSYITKKWNNLREVNPDPVPEIFIEDLTRETLLRVTNNLTNPVVIRGGVRDSFAVQNWNIDYFLENYPNEIVVVRELKGSDEEDAMSVRLQTRTIEQYARMLRNGSYGDVTIIASSSIFGRNKQLRNDTDSPLEKYLKSPKGEEIMAYQLFVTPGSFSKYHSEIANNVFRQIAGRKRWTLIDPKYSYLMCPYPLIAGTSVNPCLYSFGGNFIESITKKIPRQEVILEPGDILINAPWWWHDILSLGNQPQISVAGRLPNLAGTYSNSPLFTITSVATTCNKLL